jgi:hypothetical protein
MRLKDGSVFSKRWQRVSVLVILAFRIAKHRAPLG